jgi:transposase
MIQPVDRHRERLMRGSDQRSGSLFSYVDLESRVRGDHPLRPIREIVNGALSALSADFEAIYAAGIGRPSIPPERLLRALLLQAFYGIRSERQIMERLEYDLLFRWFVGLGVDDASWDQTTFGKNRDRLLAGDVAHKFLAAVLAHPRVKRLLSTEHFSVDGTLIEAWASMKSFRPKDGSGGPPARATSTARAATMTAMRAPPIWTPGSIARGRAARPSCASWAMRSWKTAMAWSSTPASPRPTATPSASPGSI